MKDGYYIFGLQRSGTNFFETIMKNNYAVGKRNNARGSWKHSIEEPREYDNTSPTIVIHKNPYLWVESISLRNTVDWLKTQNEYPANEVTEKRFQLGQNKFNLINLAKTYRHFHKTWLGRTQSKVVFKYEDMLNPDSRETVMYHLEERFGWKRMQKNLIVPERGKVSQSRDYDADREEYYKAQKPKVLTSEQIDKINETIGEDYIRAMGYEVINT